MSTWSTPDASDPFVGLTTIPETGDSRDELPERRPGFWVRFSHQRWAIAGLGLPPHRDRRRHLRSPGRAARSRRPGHQRGNAGPSASHWLGTDDLGRDILSRLIWGARISLRVSFEIVALAAVVAIPLGLIAGFFRGAVDSVIMRTMDALFSFPPLILALTVAALLGADINDAAIAIAIVFVPSFVRLLRGEVIAVREEAYIESARSLGATSKRLVGRHVAAERGLADHHPAGAGPRIRPPHRGGPQLPRRRRTAAHAELGRHAPGGLSVHQHGTLGARLPGFGHHAHRPGLQPGGRRPAGLARPGAPRGSSPVAGEQESRRGPWHVYGGSGGPRSTPDGGPSRMAACSTCEHLGIEFLSRGTWLPVVEDASFSVPGGRPSAWWAKAVRARPSPPSP